MFTADISRSGLLLAVCILLGCPRLPRGSLGCPRRAIAPLPLLPLHSGKRCESGCGNTERCMPSIVGTHRIMYSCQPIAQLRRYCSPECDRFESCILDEEAMRWICVHLCARDVDCDGLPCNGGGTFRIDHEPIGVCMSRDVARQAMRSRDSMRGRLR